MSRKRKTPFTLRKLSICGLWLWLCGFFVSIMLGCATSSRDRLEARQDQNRARAAAYAADGFTLDHRSPEQRPFRAWDFYYKHCSLVSRNPYPNRAEFDCASPR